MRVRRAIATRVKTATSAFVSCGCTVRKRLVALWDTVTSAESYRPEKYYMRGPGPKWRAKHMAPPADAPVIHGLASIKG